MWSPSRGRGSLASAAVSPEARPYLVDRRRLILYRLLTGLSGASQLHGRRWDSCPPGPASVASNSGRRCPRHDGPGGPQEDQPGEQIHGPVIGGSQDHRRRPARVEGGQPPPSAPSADGDDRARTPRRPSHVKAGHRRVRVLVRQLALVEWPEASEARVGIHEVHRRY